MQLGWNEATLFTLMKHRINNTGRTVKWWWNRGVERKANPDIERMLNVFDLHFSTPAEKAVARICTSKTRRNLQTFGWCLQFKQSCHSVMSFCFSFRHCSFPYIFCIPYRRKTAHFFCRTTIWEILFPALSIIAFLLFDDPCQLFISKE